MFFALFIYFIPIILSLVGAIINNRLNSVNRKLYFIIVVFFAVIVYCFVHTNGSDWPIYKKNWNELNWHNINNFAFGIEYGFWGTMLLFKTVGVGFFPFLIILKTFSLVAISSFLFKYSQKFEEGLASNVFFLLFIFYGTNALYLYVETIIRFSVALAFVVISYNYLLNRNFLFFLLFILIGTLFHRTAVLIIPLYFIKGTKLSSIKWIIIYIVIIFLLSPRVILNIIHFFNFKLFLPENFYNRVILYVQRIRNENSGLGLINLGNIVYLVFLSIIFSSRKHIEENIWNGKILFNYVMLFFVISFVTMYMGSVGRIALFLNVFFIIALLYAISTKPRFKQLLICFVVLYISFAMAKRIIGLPGVLYPYTNYLFSWI